jgi:hypothetical protein
MRRRGEVIAWPCERIWSAADRSDLRLRRRALQIHWPSMAAARRARLAQ